MAALPPTTPADWQSAEVTPGDRACDVISKFSRTTALNRSFWDWAQNADGTPTRDYLDWIGSAGGSGGTGLEAPSNVTASSNLTTKVTVAWNSVETATEYQVFRGLTADTRLMTALGSATTAVTVDDTTGDADTTYYYAVKAYNATLISGFSGTAAGKKLSSTSPSADVTYDAMTSNASLTVPAGKNRMEVELWGGGGKGGDGPDPTGQIIGTGPLVVNAGGGGASGSYYHRTNIPVTAAETFSVVVGGSGQNTRLVRTVDGSEIYATHGGNGGVGSFGAGPVGAVGSPASAAGGITFSSPGDAGSGTTVGNAGTDGFGGEPVVDTAGYEAGKGGDGATTSKGTGASGNGGRYRVRFYAV